MAMRVLVVGAGPVGLTMAAELARYGVALRIVEKAAARTDKSKALVVWSRTLELLDRAGCGGTFLDAGHRVVAANIVAGGRRVARLDLSTVDSPHPYALMLPQSETERLLEAHLNGLGASVEREVELASFTMRETGVDAVLRHADGREERVSTDWLIGCDGAHSAVRHGLGLEFLGDTMPSDWVLADVRLNGVPVPDSEIAGYWHEDGVLAAFPISPGRYRVIADLGPSRGPLPSAPTIDQVQALIDRRGPGGVTAADAVWVSTFRINERMVGNYRSGRGFVAGDAAHVHSPAGGQGMNTGMQDAFNLAWKLALVCRGTCSDRLLDSYAVERGAVGRQVLAAAGRLTAVALIRNRAAQVLRNVAGRLLFGLAPVRRALADQMTEVSIGYDDSPLNGPAASGVAGPGPGRRVVPAAGQAAPGSGGDPRFTLFAEADDATHGFVRAYPTLLGPRVRPPIHPGGTWLVRPDGYVACVAPRGDRSVVAAYLDAL